MSALVVFACGFAGVLLASHISWAKDSVPLPARKPILNQAAEHTEDNTSLLKYSLRDFARSLLDFGGPPLPPRKPFGDNNKPLSNEDIARYKTIFELQEQGRIKAADQEMKKLSNMRLRGHVLYQRYMHPTAYKSSFTELQNWMALYAAYPGAKKIYALTERKVPKDFQGNIRKPKTARGIARVRDPMMHAGKTYKSPQALSAEQYNEIKAFRKAVLSHVRKGAPDKAQALLKTDKRFALLDEVEQDMLIGRVAAGYLYTGHRKAALDLAKQSTKRSGVKAPLAGWVAGLASWQGGQYRKAAKYFEITASSPYASGWTAAAGSYWTARSHMRTGNVTAVSKWLKKAMEHPRTFYGLVATRALGHDFDFNWDVPEFTKNHRKVLLKTPTGMRAVALAEAGQVPLAEAELLRINPGKDQTLRNALLAYAGYADMPALALRLGNYISSNGRLYDAALYPKGPWQPAQGYKIDPALIHAIMRQESRFDSMAESHSGAVGLMQLMPKTAHAVARTKSVSLTNPQTNLELGQKYLRSLLKDKYVDGDLLSLLVAYNAGPGNLSRWRRQWSDIEDPLLFIELMPSRETRSYVEHVLSNYWIYRLRDGLPTPSLDAVTAGQKAKYAYNKDDKIFRLADSR